MADIETFRNMCNRFNSEIETIEGVIESQFMGMLNLQLKNLKECAKPEPERLQTALTHILPW